METRLSCHQRRKKPAGKEEAAGADEAPGNQDAIFMQMSKLIKEKQERVTISVHGYLEFSVVVLHPGRNVPQQLER